MLNPKTCNKLHLAASCCYFPPAETLGVLSQATSDSVRRFLVPEPTYNVAGVNFLNPKFSWMGKQLQNSVDEFVVP